MSKNRVPYAVAALICALTVAGTSFAKAEFFGCEDQHRARHAAYASVPTYRAGSSYTHEFAAQSRPRVTIYPRRPGPYAHRQCQSWLAKEYRLSGTVVVPRMRCWWE
jgi:hypothetical protein